MRYENALMWRMIGPHQGMRLERLRTELEKDRFAGQAVPVTQSAAKVIPSTHEVERPKVMPSLDEGDPPEGGA